MSTTQHASTVANDQYQWIRDGRPVGLDAGRCADGALDPTACGRTSGPVSLRVSFGRVAVGGTPAVRTLVVVNGSNEALLVEPLSLAGEQATAFALHDDLCGGMRLEPGGACSVDVAFAPRGVRAVSAELPLMTTGAQSAYGTFLLSGAGVPGERHGGVDGLCIESRGRARRHVVGGRRSAHAGTGR